MIGVVLVDLVGRPTDGCDVWPRGRRETRLSKSSNFNAIIVWMSSASMMSSSNSCPSVSSACTFSSKAGSAFHSLSNFILYTLSDFSCLVVAARSLGSAGLARRMSSSVIVFVTIPR